MTQIRVGILPVGDLFETNTSKNGDVTVTGGLEAKFVSLLSQGLGAKFKYKIPKDYDWGVLMAGGNWTGLIGMLRRSEVDIAVAKITLTEARSLAVGSSYPYAIDELTFATRLPVLLPNTAALINPFSTNVWISLLIFLIAYPFIIRLILPKMCSQKGLFFNIFGSILNKNISLELSCFKDRVLFIFWIYGAMLISMSYTTSLLSFLTIPIKTYGVRNIAELSKAAFTGEYKCAPLIGTGSIEILLSNKTSSTKSIVKRMNENNIEFSRDKPSILLRLYNEKVVIIATRHDLQNILDPYAYIASETFGIILATVMINNNFKDSQKLNTAIHRIREADLYQKLVRDRFFLQQLRSRDFKLPQEIHPRRLGIVDILGVLILLAVGYALSIVTFLGELLFSKIEETSKNCKKCIH